MKAHPGIYRHIVKRILDILASAIILILISPILIVIAAVIRLSIGAPVIFSQMRPGLMGKPFKIYKFRTMTNAKDKHGELLPDEERSTRMGQWIRSLSLDELPEFFNVLRGDMSLVGPRPLLMRYLPRFSAEQSRRHELKSGITGWAQINGRNDISWDERLAMDVWYVDNASFMLDMYILFKTVWKVILRDGVSQEGHFSSPEFWGNVKEEDPVRREWEEGDRRKGK